MKQPLFSKYDLGKVLEGKFADGIHGAEVLISQLEKKHYRDGADCFRLNLAEIYLEIIEGHERPRVTVLLKNLPFLLRLMVTARSRIRGLTQHVLENPNLDPAGYFIGYANMVLGLLAKGEKKRALALEHLNKARRILSQFGQTPRLARVDAALADLGQ